MKALFLAYRLEKKQRDVKWFVRDYRGRSVGSGIDTRYPKISSDFLSLLGEAKFLHWWQQLTEEKLFFLFWSYIWYKHNSFSILCVHASLVTKRLEFGMKGYNSCTLEGEEWNISLNLYSIFHIFLALVTFLWGKLWIPSLIINLLLLEHNSTECISSRKKLQQGVSHWW